MQTILVRVGEMYLKGRNRPYFTRQLMKKLQQAVEGFGGRVKGGEGRLYIEGAQDIEGAMQAASRVFGIFSLSPATPCEKDLDAITDVAASMLGQHQPGTFRVTARRADKRFPMTSDALAAELGGRLLERCPEWQVDLHTFDVNVQVEIRECAYVYTRTVEGAGGMPAGTNGKAALLLSGGIDSPVAGWMTARRGVQLECVYFHSFPYTSEHAHQKVVSLARILAGYTGPIRLHTVPFTDIQLAIRDKCPDALGTVLMRRYMMRLAERIAIKNNAQALVTGESIGQVASQTMEGLACSNEVVDMPVFRPLIGMDKIDIMRMARHIGTYETSILPYEDCCTVFTPKNPATHPRVERVREAELALDSEALISAALEGVQVELIGQEDDVGGQA
nr:tRNA 4-thiouridine(8) synthase ThiI [bacterium]